MVKVTVNIIKSASRLSFFKVAFGSLVVGLGAIVSILNAPDREAAKPAIRRSSKAFVLASVFGLLGFKSAKRPLRGLACVSIAALSLFGLGANAADDFDDLVQVGTVS